MLFALHVGIRVSVIVSFRNLWEHAHGWCQFQVSLIIKGGVVSIEYS